MTEERVKLAQCLRCYREPEHFGMSIFRVRCPSCDAMTPPFDLSVNADAAWNRMMGDARTTTQCCDDYTDARTLLSALADELDEMADHGTKQQIVSAIRAVLDKKQ